MRMKTKFKKTAPKVTGWYWVKYQGKRGIVICPARFLEISKWGDNFEWTVHTALNDLFHSKMPHKDLMFGSKIEEPK